MAKQPGITVLVVGKPKSGKSTLAWAIRDAMLRAGIFTDINDPDETEQPSFQAQRLAALAKKEGFSVAIRTEISQNLPPVDCR